MRAGCFALLACVLVGCGATVRRDGFTLYEEDTRESINTVVNRAAFDMSCPREQIQTRVIATFQPPSMYPGQIGAEGCGHRTVYVRASGTWVANSVNTDPNAR